MTKMIGKFLEQAGRDGALAISFSNLLQDMWSGKPSAVKPSDLKVYNNDCHKLLYTFSII